MAIDRKALIERSARRMLDEALEDAISNSRSTGMSLASAGRQGGQRSGVFEADVFAQKFQDGCIRVLDKVQLEDRPNALDMAEELSTKVLSGIRRKFAEAYMEASISKRPPLSSPGYNAWSNAFTQMDSRLSTLQHNAVEEFQLAMTRHERNAAAPVHIASYVHADRLTELRELTSVVWDFSRLIALCEETNVAWQYGLHYSVAMLVRAILDHVPPVFGQKSFSAVASSYSGTKSFKETMQNLDSLSRKIADGYLHTQIRSKEAAPNSNQVDFRAGVDVLLSEVVRVTPGNR